MLMVASRGHALRTFGLGNTWRFCEELVHLETPSSGPTQALASGCWQLSPYSRGLLIVSHCLQEAPQLEVVWPLISAPSPV